ncbi:MAG: PAS domain-containing protein [Williamsia sp.]|nr:PAS domain-containing protein [Williamsia sp.]
MDDKAYLQKSEAALRVKEERYRTLFDLTTEGLCILEVLFDENDKPFDYRFLEVNHAFEKQTGLLNPIGSTVKQFDPTHEQCWFDTYGRIVKTGVPERFEYSNAHVQRCYAAYACRIGKPAENQVVVFFNDVTERKKTEQEVLNANEKMKLALEGAKAGYGYWNHKTGETSWDERGKAIMGFAPGEDITADDWFHRIHEEDRIKVKAYSALCAEEGRNFNMEYRIILPGGEVRYIEGSGHFKRDNKGEPLESFGLVIDITERKLLERQKEEFISIASHELKTPITSIRAYGEVLKDLLEEGRDTTSTDLIRKSNAQVDRLVGLINSLLDTTKLSEGELPLNKELLNIGNLIKEHVDDQRHIFPNSSILTTECQDIIILADSERIGQVLTNLISNAIKYSSKEGKVQIKCQRLEGNVVVSVQDQGIGIPKEMQQKVFDRFFRVPDVKRRNYPGIGLGLYITAGIIHRHGGRIWVESVPGKGSTFYFTLPV